MDDDCDCEPDAGDEGYEPTHFTRTCAACGFQWEALHCPHDGVQNPCPGCGWVAPGARTPLQVLGFDPPPPA